MCQQSLRRIQTQTEVHPRFEVLVDVKMWIVAFRVVMQCRLVSACQSFGGTYSFNLRGRSEDKC